MAHASMELGPWLIRDRADHRRAGPRQRDDRPQHPGAPVARAAAAAAPAAAGPGSTATSTSSGSRRSSSCRPRASTSRRSADCSTGRARRTSWPSRARSRSRSRTSSPRMVRVEELFERWGDSASPELLRRAYALGVIREREDGDGHRAAQPAAGPRGSRAGRARDLAAHRASRSWRRAKAHLEAIADGLRRALPRRGLAAVRRCGAARGGLAEGQRRARAAAAAGRRVGDRPVRRAHDRHGARGDGPGGRPPAARESVRSVTRRTSTR